MNTNRVHLHTLSAILLVLASGFVRGEQAALEEYSVDRLFELSLVELFELRVTTPSKTEEAFNTSAAILSVITRSEITSFGANSLFDVLDRAAGVFIYGSYYLPNNMISIRGEASSHYTTHVLILVNGRPLHSSKEGYLLPILSAFPLEAVDRIEILRGPGSTLYGSTAYVGVINIVTKKAPSQSSHAGFRFGSFGTGMATVSTAFETENFDITLNGSFMGEEGWKVRIRDADDQGNLRPFIEDKAEERAYGLQSILNYKAFSANLFYASNYITNGFQLQNVYNWPELNLGTDRGMLNLGYSKKVSDAYNLDLNFTYNYQYYWQPFDDLANDYREIGTSHDYLLELTQHFKPSKSWSFSVGALASQFTGVIKNNEQLADGSFYNVWENPPNPDPFLVVPSYKDVNYSGYINANYQRTDKLKLVAGIHLNKSAYTSLDLSPRVGVVYEINPEWSYKLLYSEAFRSPDNFEIYSTIPAILGNRNLKPEKIRTLESEILYGQDRMLLTASAFVNRQENLINRRNISGTPEVVSQQFTNEGEIHSWGLESTAKVNITNSIKLNASFSYHEVEIVNGVEDPFGVPNLYAKLGLSYSARAYTVGLFNSYYNYVGAAYGYDVLFPEANPAVDDFLYTTLNCDIKLSELWDIGNGSSDIVANLYIVNLFDEDIYYAEYGRKLVNSATGRPGIGAYAGVKIYF